MTASLSVLGASARAASGSAVRGGFRPCAVDLFADVDTQAMAKTIRIADYPNDFAKIIDQLPDGPWIYTGGLENYPELIDTIAAERPLWGNCGEVLRAVRQPAIWSDVLQRAGIFVPRILMDFAEVPRDAHWLAKPLRSAGGIGICEVDEQYQLPSEGATNIFFQERVAGTSAGAVFVAAGGKSTLLGTTQQLTFMSVTDAPLYQYAGSVGPLDLHEDTVAEITRIGDALAAAFALQGLFGVDGILHKLHFWPIEINPRYTASIEILERASGANFLQLHADACCHATLPSPPSFGNVKHGKAVLYASRDTRFTRIAAKWSADWNKSQTFPVVADIPAEGETIPVDAPIATLFGHDEKLTEWVVGQLRVRCQTLRTVLEESE